MSAGRSGRPSDAPRASCHPALRPPPPTSRTRHAPQPALCCPLHASLFRSARQCLRHRLPFTTALASSDLRIRATRREQANTHALAVATPDCHVVLSATQSPPSYAPIIESTRFGGASSTLRLTQLRPPSLGYSRQNVQKLRCCEKVQSFACVCHPLANTSARAARPCRLVHNAESLKINENGKSYDRKRGSQTVDWSKPLRKARTPVQG